MEDELQKARVISDRMFKAHNERDFDLDWHKEKADQLSERWQNIHSQIDSRLALITLTLNFCTRRSNLQVKCASIISIIVLMNVNCSISGFGSLMVSANL